MASSRASSRWSGPSASAKTCASPRSLLLADASGWAKPRSRSAGTASTLVTAARLPPSNLAAGGRTRVLRWLLEVHWHYDPDSSPLEDNLDRIKPALTAEAQVIAENASEIVDIS